MIAIIVAYDENRVIGNKGKVPWHIPDDLNFFKTKTFGSPVIMGRKTYDSLPDRFKPLPGRLNIVVSRTQKGSDLYFYPNAPQYASSLDRALEICDLTNPGCDWWIIGGGEIYKEAIEKSLVDEIWASEVKGDFGGDVFFPKLKGWIGEVVKSYDDFDVVKYKKVQK